MSGFTQKVSGIKEVSFKIEAKGYGIVNWNVNHPVLIINQEGKTLKVKNIKFPKLQNFTTAYLKEEKLQTKFLDQVESDVQSSQLYVSANCARGYLFKDFRYDEHHLDFTNTTQLINFLASPIGLIRGFIIPKTENKRETALYIQDFIENSDNGCIYEQNSSAKFDKDNERDSKNVSKSETSYYGKFTKGETSYVSYGRVNIETLQFIPLDRRYLTQAIPIDQSDVNQLVERIESYLNEINSDSSLTPKATFHTNYVRKVGNKSSFKNGLEGILLNDDAIQILVNAIINEIENFRIEPSATRGWLKVTNVDIDYNDTNKMFRVQDDINNIQQTRENRPYATYFTAIDSE